MDTNKKSFLVIFFLLFILANSTETPTKHFQDFDGHKQNGCHKQCNIKQVILIPLDVENLGTKMFGATMSEHVLNPVSGLLKRGARSVFQDAGNPSSIGFEAKTNIHHVTRETEKQQTDWLLSIGNELHEMSLEWLQEQY